MPTVNQKGAGKVHPSLAKKDMNKTKTTSKKAVKKHKYKYHKTALKTLKRKIKRRITDDSPQALSISFRLSTAFLKKILRRYARVLNTENETKRSNYSLFLSILATSLQKVVHMNEDFFDKVKHPSLFNTDIAVYEPHEYIAHFLHFVDEEDPVKELKEAAAKYFAMEVRSTKRMLTTNNEHKLEEAQEEYLEISHFIQGVSEAVAETIRDYSKDLKEHRKINENMNLNELILGLTEVNLAANEPNKNVDELDDLLTKLLL